MISANVKFHLVSQFHSKIRTKCKVLVWLIFGQNRKTIIICYTQTLDELQCVANTNGGFSTICSCFRKRSLAKIATATDDAPRSTRYTVLNWPSREGHKIILFGLAMRFVRIIMLC